MDKISLLLPSKGRSKKIEKSIESFLNCAGDLSNIELIVGIEKKEIDFYNPILSKFDKIKTVLFDDCDFNVNQKYNMLYKKVEYNIVFGIADDNIMTTVNYDKMIIDEFEKWPDKLICLVVNDGLDSNRLYRHFILHRNWIETVGYYYIEKFKHYFNDNIMTIVSKTIKRNIYKSELVMTHLHPVFGTAENDLTYQNENKFMQEDWQMFYNILADTVSYEVNKLLNKIKEAENAS